LAEWDYFLSIFQVKAGLQRADLGIILGLINFFQFFYQKAWTEGGSTGFFPFGKQLWAGS